MNSYQQLFAAVSITLSAFAQTSQSTTDRRLKPIPPCRICIGPAVWHDVAILATNRRRFWPKYGERVKYLFGSADRDHVLDQKIVVAKYHTIKSNSPESFRCHHFDGSRLRAITVDAAVVVAERYAVKIRETWRIERMKTKTWRSIAAGVSAPRLAKCVAEFI